MVISPRRRAAPAEPSFLEGYLPYLLGLASYAINKDFDGDVKAAGLSPLEWRTLATLSDCDGMTVGALCRKVVSRQPTQTKAIKRLDEIGLVRREDDASDLRRTRVFITARGRAVARDLIRAAKAHERQMVRHLTPAQLDALTSALRQILAQGQLAGRVAPELLPAARRDQPLEDAA